MTTLQMDNSILEDVIYYIIIAWKKEEFWGKQHKIAYKTERNAIKQAAKMYASGNYSVVNVRKEEVFKRVPGITEYSASGVVKSYGAFA